MDGSPRYSLRQKIHEGQHSIIFRGVDEDQTPVVIKVLKGEYPSPRALAQLRREYNTLREIDLPGVIKAFALENYGNGLALVMEDAGGEPLSDVLREHAMTLRRALEIALSVARTLAQLHQRSIVHKDIKPHNILVNRSTGEVKLIDFGIAMRIAQETARPSNPDSLEGTLMYMSPEQSGRMNRVVDPRTDLYSLGVTLYEMVTGTLPFSSSDAMELVHSHIARTPAPPRTRAPTVPQVVSDIVVKLLAKAPEDRYQHALGLAADLSLCLERLDERGDVAAFELARHDMPEVLRIPQTLYGRAEDIKALLDAFARVHVGRPELMLIAGAAGVGKSALVFEVHKAIARSGGRFTAGKFDLAQRATPFGALSRAFGDLVRHVLTEAPAALAEWRSRLRGALGTNAQVMIDIIPELELIVGPQPPVPALRPTETQNRFGLVFQNFARVFCDQGAPLVLFLDDLQWVDQASLSLLRLLLTDPAGGHLLIVGAYRDGEVEASHVLMLGLEDLRKERVPISTRTLGPLDPGSVRALLADSLGRADEARAPIDYNPEPGTLDGLSQYVFAKTHGNPFFLTQFLLTLHQRGLLVLDRTTGRWTWDEAKIAAEPITDNVVDFMSEKLRELPPDAQQLIAAAACIGNEFDLVTLARVADRSLGVVAADLWPALCNGLLIPLDSDYRLVTGGADAGGDGELADTPGLVITCRFLHDRVQQAALTLAVDDSVDLAHLRIARILRDRHAADPRVDTLFDVVRHFNAALPVLSDPDERMTVARLNLEAGRTAKTATAYAAAADFLTTGIAMLPFSAWDDDYDLTFALQRELAECDYLSGRMEHADHEFAELLARARSADAKADIYAVRVLLLTSAGRFADALAAAREALALFGVHLPETPEEIGAGFGALLGEIAGLMQGRTVESLVDAPAITEPHLRAQFRVLGDVFGAAFILDARLGAVVILQQIVFALRHGNDVPAAYAYASYAYILAGPLGNPQEALRFGHLGLALLERFPSAESASRVHFMFAFIACHTLPLRVLQAHNRKALKLGLEAGEFLYASQGAAFEVMTRLRLGEELGSLREGVAQAGAVMQRTQDAMSTAQLLCVRNAVDALQTRLWWEEPLDEDSPDEAAWLAGIDAFGMVVIRVLHHILKLMVLTVFGEHARGQALIAWVEPRMATAVGAPYTSDFPFYAALTLAARHDSTPADARPALLADIVRHRDNTAVWAKNCPDNEQHRLYILDAELARLRGEDLAAMDDYDRAIEWARKNNYPHHEALANELCGNFHLARGRAQVARVYLGQARFGYERWGAFAKVRDLDARHPFLVTRSESAPLATTSTGRPFDTSSLSTGGNQGLDLATVIKASQAFTMEIELQPLLEKIVHIMVENAGARRGVLLLDQDGQLFVAAESAADTGPYTLKQPIPLKEADSLPTSVIHYVAHTSDSVILDDASRSGPFTTDAYIDARATRSLLCVPLILKAKLVGVLYLENDLTQGVFSENRLKAIKLIATQAAISIENANLYANMERLVRKRTDELSRVNESLTASNAELDAFARTVAHDLKNPLGAVAGYSEYLLENLHDLEPGEAEKVVDNIRRASDTATSIVDELLLLAGVRKQQVQSTRLDMRTILRQVQQRMAYMLREYQGELTVPDRWPVAYGYAPWIEEAWTNYISNGLKYGGPKLDLGADELDDGSLRFWVRDHGPGIPADAQARLFAEFTRLDEVRTEGHGLGLSIVRRIIERLGGRVGVESTVGEGSLFFFTLPGPPTDPPADA